MNPLPPAALTALLAAIGLLNSVGSDLVVPGLPALRDDLQTSDWQAQQVISLFFGACAFMSLWYGALADAWGRRTVTLGVLVIIALTTIGCLLSSRIEQIWVLRTLQGLASGAGLVISRTIVRDLYTGLTAQRLLSRIMMIQTIALVGMPALGGWLVHVWGWRALFAVSTGFIAALAFACWRWLPETLPRPQRRPLQLTALWNAYSEVIRNGSFMRLSLAHVANWVGMALYAFAAPAFVMRHLGRETADVYLVFLAMTAGLCTGFIAFPRLARTRPGAAVLALAYRIIALAVLANLTLCGLLAPGLIHLLPIFLYTIGMALALPILIDWALTPVHPHAGVAASCQTFLQFAAMAICAGILVPLLWDSLFDLALGSAAITATGALCLFMERRQRRIASLTAT
jgi:MFS transporter, DHA1 family, multidrug resistance protein